MKRSLVALLLVLPLVLGAGGHAAAAGDPPAASAFDFVRFPTPQPGCTGIGLRGSPYFTRGDCGFGEVTLAGVSETAHVRATLADAQGRALATVDATHDAGEVWQYEIRPAADWPAGPVTATLSVDGVAAAGEGTFHVNQLGVELAPKPGAYAPGDAIELVGKAYTLHSVGTDTQREGVAATFKLRAVDAGGAVLGTSGPFTAAADGSVTASLPAGTTAGVKPGKATGYRESIRLELVDAHATGALPTGEEWGAPDGTAAGAATVETPPAGLVLENSFVSSKGWVRPGETYPFTVRVENYERTAIADGGEVTVSVPAGTTLLSASTWAVGSVPAATDAGPGVRTKVFEARAATLTEDPRIAWKDLSATATLSGDDTPVASHGPKVIPPAGGFDTARYGDRPFPVVPVDYSERSHAAESSAGKLAGKINDPEHPGSTFNLYQEMSYGQLFPHGTVPSDGVAARGWGYAPGFEFTTNSVDADTCRGLTNATLPGETYQQLQPNRIEDGWYQLPGSTDTTATTARAPR
jgi:immune inhibitor A